MVGNIYLIVLIFIIFTLFCKGQTIDCEGETILTSMSGTISYSLSSFNETKSCLWFITPPNVEWIVLTVLLFSVEMKDKLSVLDNDNNTLGSFVGVVENLPVVVLSGSVLYLEWQPSDILKSSNRTWQVEYRSVYSVIGSNSWKCPVGFTLTSDQMSCTPLPCVFTEWSKWEPCADCSGDSIIISRREVDMNKSNGSPLCKITPVPIYQVLQQNYLTNDLLASFDISFILKDQFLQNSWLAYQFQYSLNGSSFNITKIHQENDYLSILVNDVTSSQYNSTSCSPNTTMVLSEVAIPFLINASIQIIPYIDPTRLVIKTIQNQCGLAITVKDLPVSISITLSIALPVGLATFFILLTRIIYILKKRKLNDLLSLPLQVRICFEDAQNHHSSWIKSGNSTNKFYLKYLEENSDKYKHAYDLFRNHLHGKDIDVQCIEAVYNPNLVNAFICSRKNMQARIKANQDMFLSQDWKKQDTDGKRAWVYKKYCDYVNQFDWNKEDETNVPIIPVVHGTDLFIAWKICETGFIALSTLDSGWYGKGIYFSSSSRYILPYYLTRKRPAIIIAYAIPGNPFPIIESPKGPDSLLGTPIKGGVYPSHYIVVTRNGYPPTDMSETRLYDELVLNQESMVIPAFIVLPETSSIRSLADLYNRPVVLPS